jgi:Tfp pilus assembly protein PilF
MNYEKDMTTIDASTADLPVSTEVVQTLMEVGYVAAGRGSKSNAEDIFKGVSAARPSSELPLIGLAVTEINFGDFLTASKILVEQALKINPDSGLAKCFLAMASKALGDKSVAEDLAKEISSSEKAEPEAKALAESFLTGKDIAAPASG